MKRERMFSSFVQYLVKINSNSNHSGALNQLHHFWMNDIY
jgi:hypothetical protein